MNSSNRRLVILILGALSTVSPLAIDMYLAAFPEMARHFNTSASTIALTLASYFIGIALGILFYGPLMDRYGRRPPLFAGLTIFILASIASMFAPNVETLIALRFLQALGGCVGQVGAMAMVRDFFRHDEASKILSILTLIIGVSPLMAPTLGGFIVTSFGWSWVFFAQGLMVALILLVCFFFLPVGYTPDKTLKLHPAVIARNFWQIFCDPQFNTYALTMALSFSGLLVYVSGSPIIFMEVYQVSAQVYGIIFATLSVGFIGGSQVNIWLTKKLSSETILRRAVIAQCVVAVLLAVGTAFDQLGLSSMVVLIFCYLSCLGLTTPNGTALALAPFTKNAGQASALVGFLQIGMGSLCSGLVGLFPGASALPTVCVLLLSAFMGLAMYFFGRRRITRLVDADPNEASVIH